MKIKHLSTALSIIMFLGIMVFLSAIGLVPVGGLAKSNPNHELHDKILTIGFISGCIAFACLAILISINNYKK